MRNTILAAVVAFVIGGIATGALVADAQPAPPPPGQVMEGPGAGGGPGMDGRGGRPWMHGWMHRMHGPMNGSDAARPAPGTFALVFRHEDRQLAPADVQKIAEAFLVWQGNHTWKIIDVAATPEGPIGFAVATPEGAVIARFTMDPHSGRVSRQG
ncbi:MAG: hypothetical protein P4L71_05340 [Acetobacteraceae bacterium]|nr:hypothetical protein [Acetobacteraceae bacterium]